MSAHLTLHGYYMDVAVGDLAGVADDLAAQTAHKRYDTLVGTGLSGALVVPRLAEQLGKLWAVVRKPDDGSHSSYPVEGRLGHRWLFVDDLVSSGTTYRRAYEAIQRAGQKESWRISHAGAYLYKDPGFIDSARARRVYKLRDIDAELRREAHEAERLRRLREETLVASALRQNPDAAGDYIGDRVAIPVRGRLFDVETLMIDADRFEAIKAEVMDDLLNRAETPIY